MSNSTTKVIEQLVTTIDRVPAKNQTKLIALDGRGGSGKSTLARLLVQMRPEYQIVQLDSFPCRADEHPFHPLGTQTAISTERILADVIYPLQEGGGARYARTPWWPGQPETFEQVLPGGTVIFEGCYSLSTALRNHYDLRIWVHRELPEALADALARDGGERDRVVWEQAYIPRESEYIESQKPAECADIVVANRRRVFSVERTGNP